MRVRVWEQVRVLNLNIAQVKHVTRLGFEHTPYFSMLDSHSKAAFCASNQSVSLTCHGKQNVIGCMARRGMTRIVQAGCYPADAGTQTSQAPDLGRSFADHRFCNLGCYQTQLCARTPLHVLYQASLLSLPTTTRAYANVNQC